MPAAPAGYVPEALEALTAPHIDSFDYFLSDGLRLVVQGLAPIEVKLVCFPVPPPPLISIHRVRRLAGLLIDLARERASSSTVLMSCFMTASGGACAAGGGPWAAAVLPHVV